MLGKKPAVKKEELEAPVTDIAANRTKRAVASKTKAYLIDSDDSDEDFYEPQEIERGGEEAESRRRKAKDRIPLRGRRYARCR